MPAAVISIVSTHGLPPRTWSLLEVALAGLQTPVRWASCWSTRPDRLRLRLRKARLSTNSRTRGRYDRRSARGPRKKAADPARPHLLSSLENSLSDFLRLRPHGHGIHRQSAARRRPAVRRVCGRRSAAVVTHLPLYRLRAAATKFGEGMDSPLEEWIRVPDNLHD